MINLTTLSALLRSLRYSGGPDAPAAPVARVPPVTSLTPDDSAAMTAAALRVAARSHAQTPHPALPADPRVPTTPGRDANTRASDLGTAPIEGTRAPPRAITAPLLSAADVESSTLDFTSGARLLQVAMRGSAGTLPLPPAVTPAFPLVGNDHSPTVELARGLAQSLVESGLFYESHLARWVRRDYPVSALLREPQSAWAASATASGASAAVATPTALPEAASQLLARQLDALDTRALVWTGELWPRQHASVAFEQNEPVADEEDDAEAPVGGAGWRTRVSIDLPSLGRIEATLVMRGATLDLMLEAEDPGARVRLMHAHESLTASLAGSAVVLGNFGVAFGATE